MNKCQGAIASKDYGKAYVTCIVSARSGDMQAQYDVGTLYEAGLGVKKTYKKAVFWYQKSAEQGHTLAMNKLGLAYLDGVGVSSNNQQAWLWLNKAYQAGNVYAYKNIMKMCALHKVKANICQTPDMKWAISVAYRKGTAPLSKDNVREFQYGLQAAQLGHAAAMGQVGFLYDVGRGVKHNYYLAAHWYHKALLKGNFSVSNRLGGLYDEGSGVPRDTTKAFQFHKGAAERGSVFGMFDLAWCYHYGNGTTKNIQKAKGWYQKAVKAGNDDAKAALEVLQKDEALSPKLFGHNMAWATQLDMRKAIQSAGGKVIQEDESQFWFDKYDSSMLLKGTDELVMGYVDESKLLASVVYHFPRLKHGEIEKIKTMLVTKYGPSVSVGNTAQGAVKYTWKVGVIEISFIALKLLWLRIWSTCTLCIVKLCIGKWIMKSICRLLRSTNNNLQLFKPLYFLQYVYASSSRNI